MVSDENLTFLVTVTYRCEDMIDRKALDEHCNGDPLEAYRYVSDDFKEDVAGFGHMIGEPRVEIDEAGVLSDSI